MSHDATATVRGGGHIVRIEKVDEKETWHEVRADCWCGWRERARTMLEIEQRVARHMSGKTGVVERC